MGCTGFGWLWCCECLNTFDGLREILSSSIFENSNREMIVFTKGEGMKGKKYLILTYLLTALIVFYFSVSSEKQVISNYNVVFGFKDFFQILFKNLIASVWLLLSYVFGESIIYIFFVINGIVLGLLLSSFSSVMYLLLILPHGIIEIGAYVYLADTIMTIKSKNQGKKIVAKHFICFFLLLTLAAGIETFITPLMINFLS